MMRRPAAARLILSLSRPLSAALVSLPLLFAAPAGQAGFLQDFYDEAGAQTNYTAAGLYASSTMSLVTGGRFMMKVPREDFHPYYLQAPSLSAGCGGIDVFLGAFSVPSKEEFLSFLRSIGTALPGLAFQLALQSLAPDLNEQVSQFRDMLMKLSKDMGDSCQAAQTILDATGASAWLTGMGSRARNALRSSGTAEDQSDADSLTRANGERVFESAPMRSDTAGNVLEAPELNLTWALLKGGKGSAALTQTRRETMMTLVGTLVYVKSGTGADATVEERAFAPLDLLSVMLGDETTPMLPADAEIYRCDEPERCLNPTRAQVSDINLTHAIYQAMLRYRLSLTSRNPQAVSDEDLRLLAGISSLPLLRMTELAASPRLIGFSDAYLLTYAEAAAYEGLLAALGQLAADVRLAVTGSSARDANAYTAEHAALLEARLAELTADLRAREQTVALRMNRVSAFLDEVSHLSRVVYGEPASTLLPTVPGAAE